YNHSISFADAEAVERFIAENGYRKVFERERKRKGGVKRYYLCSAFWDWSIKCDHKFTLIAADGVFVGKTTDGGRPHDHRPIYDGCSNDPAPAAAKMKPESSVDVSEESEQQLQNLIRECS
uniref:FLYWCH-type domain-containing protein n=1 Tax=Parascaris univalens TaxID=6257 RepID=A0A915BCB9_PARUN